MHTWYGEAVNWECDELGHLNMRHYMTKVDQARQMFIMALGLDGAFRDGAVSTVRVQDFHIRYHRETLPGGRLGIQTAMVAIRDTDMDIVHIISHHDGTVAATIVETLSHISLRTRQAFSWPRRVRTAVAPYQVDVPDIAKPRGLSLRDPGHGPELKTLQDWDLMKIGAGVFILAETNMHGFVTEQAILGRISESIGNMSRGWPEIYDEVSMNAGIMGVLLEARVFIHRRPEAGEPYVMYSGVSGATAHVRQLIHHVVHPFTGQSWASMIAVGGLIDLNTRQFVRPTADQVQAIAADITPGLTA